LSCAHAGCIPEDATSRLAAVAERTRIVFSEGLTLIVHGDLESVRSALTQYEGGQAFPEFKSASGEDVCVASARVAYIERAPAEGQEPPAVDPTALGDSRSRS
jgi:hypothetical protein